MKNTLLASNGEHFVARIFKSISILLIALALSTGFWMASAPSVYAQGSPTEMIESQLPEGRTTQTADKADYLAAVCAAVKKWRSAAPAITEAAITAKPPWKNDILRTVFRCLGTDDCRLLGRVLRFAIRAAPGDANELTQLALEMAPGCADAFGGKPPPDDEGIFGVAPGNQNPPPGSIGGGGGQGNVLVVCFQGETRVVNPDQAQNLIDQGATVGACQVTPNTNQ